MVADISVQSSHTVMSDCDPMDCSTPGLPVHHQLPELAQTHVHRVGNIYQIEKKNTLFLIDEEMDESLLWMVISASSHFFV